MPASPAASSEHEYNVTTPALHSLHECRTIEEFRPRFEAATGCSMGRIADHVVRASAPKAIFLVGSLSLGMGTSGSDVDLIVLVDDKSTVVGSEARVANSDQRLEFSNDSDPLLAGNFLALKNGILLEVQVAITPAIHAVYRRLHRRGPDLNETEIRTLGRLSTGWLLWETDDYLRHNAVSFVDTSLSIYCSTRSFVSALLQRSKAFRALERQDIPLALHHGRTSIEEAYLAYFASEGLPYLGSKWLAQLGHASHAAQRLARHPLLKTGVRLLFPTLVSTQPEAAQYVRESADFLASIRGLIEQRMAFRIAFSACPQIASAR